MTENDIVKVTSTRNTYTVPGKKNEYIAIHYTAGITSRKGSARNVANFFGSSAIDASADFAVDDVECVQYNPDPTRFACWAVGDPRNWIGGSLYGRATNYNTISIEICSSNTTGRITSPNDAYFYFTEAAVKNAVELTKFLMKKYNIPESHVIRHFDVSGKACPGVCGWGTDGKEDSAWKAFKAALKGESVAVPSDKGENQSDSKKVPFKVRVKINDLNVRTGPGTEYTRIQYCPIGAYTIVEVREGTGSDEGWGFLKSGLGWISLDYVEMV